MIIISQKIRAKYVDKLQLSSTFREARYSTFLKALLAFPISPQLFFNLYLEWIFFYNISHSSAFLIKYSNHDLTLSVIPTMLL